MRIAVITGASSGLGAEFVKQLDQDPSFDAYWVIARRRERLVQLAELTNKPLITLPMDVTSSEDLKLLKDRLQREQPVIDLLINAAGCGIMGRSDTLTVEENTRMLRLNAEALVTMTTICLPYMAKGSRIIQVASTSGFQPIPGLNVYSATKAFVIRYSKALHYELRKQGIKVTALCPYWISDTEFIGLADKGKQEGFRSFPFASKKKNVVKTAIRDNKWNFRVSTPGVMCTMHRILTRIFPDFITVPVMDLFRRL